MHASRQDDVQLLRREPPRGQHVFYDVCLLHGMCGPGYSVHHQLRWHFTSRTIHLHTYISSSLKVVEMHTWSSDWKRVIIIVINTIYTCMFDKTNALAREDADVSQTQLYAGNLLLQVTVLQFT
jgi:hypothetical protein